jgi:hypothetical protein
MLLVLIAVAAAMMAPIPLARRSRHFHELVWAHELSRVDYLNASSRAWAQIGRTGRTKEEIRLTEERIQDLERQRDRIEARNPHGANVPCSVVSLPARLAIEREQGYLREFRRFLKWLEGWETRANRAQGLADYHARLAAKYHRAAHYPWLPVEPDPPAPK